jgi:5-formyltetrahydrofolate cyclo-ligase
VPENSPPSKAEIRAQARNHRKNRLGDETETERLIDQAIDYLAPVEGVKIALYWPMGSELDALPLMDELYRRGAIILLPCLPEGSRMMKFAQWTPETSMKPNKHGVPEPADYSEEKPDIVLAPLLAFDQKGTRLGQGGGYYDATLASLREGGPVQYGALAYDDQGVLFALPREAHDQMLDFVITPNRIVEFDR